MFFSLCKLITMASYFYTRHSNLDFDALFWFCWILFYCACRKSKLRSTTIISIQTVILHTCNPLADPGFSFGGTGWAPKARVSRRRRRQGVEFREGVYCFPLPRICFWFVCLGMVHFACILKHDYTVHNARINKVKACKKLRYRHQTVQSRHHSY